MRVRILALFIALALAATAIAAEEMTGSTEPSLSVGLDNIKVNWFGFVPTGPILKFGYGSLGLLPGLRSDLEGKFGVGYENIKNPRHDTTDSVGGWLAGDPVLWKDRYGVDMPDAQIELGFRQGILPLEESRDHLSAFASLHGRIAANLGADWSSTLPDRNDELMASLVLGLRLEDETKNAHSVREGHSALLEGEWGPSFLSAQGTDFLRLKAEWVEYLPLFDLPGERNLLSSYLALRANLKYIDGTRVPLFMLEETDVRGYAYALDTKLRASGSLEARLDLPSFVGASGVFPVLFAFADGGWYSGWTNLDAASTWKDSAGPLGSVGAGFAVDVFGFARPTITVAWPLIDADAAGKKVGNIDGTLWLSIHFDLHY